jgi:hypothetical protein
MRKEGEENQRLNSSDVNNGRLTLKKRFSLPLRRLHLDWLLVWNSNPSGLMRWMRCKRIDGESRFEKD